MKHTQGDISLFTKSVQKKLKGMTVLYVDDSHSCGNKEFFEDFDKTSKGFNSNINTDNIYFAGIKLDQVTNGHKLHQSMYAKKLRILHKMLIFQNFDP